MLADLAVRKAVAREKPYKLSDGGGLYLLAPIVLFITSQKVYKNRRNPGALALGWFRIVLGVPDIFAGLLQAFCKNRQEKARPWL